MPCCSKTTAVVVPEPIPAKSEPDKSKVNYTITIKTGPLTTAGINGAVYIKIFGRDNKQTEEILLTKSSADQSFLPDSEREFQIQANDIGKPRRIIIRHEDPTNGWYLDYVNILVHDSLFRFAANRWLHESKNDRKRSVELFASEHLAVEYEIEIQTGSEQDQPMDSPVYVQIYGTTTSTSKLFLEPKTGSFTRDSTRKFVVSSNNVGQIEKVILGHEALGTVNDWYVHHVRIRQSEQEHEFTVNKCLSSTIGERQLFVELTQQPPRTPSSSAPLVYLITIHTADVPRAETREDIKLSIRGSRRRTERLSLKEYAKSNEKALFQQGSTDNFELQYKDVGKIESITIGFDPKESNAAWLLEGVDIQYKDTTYHFRAQCWLSSRLGASCTWLTLKPDKNHEEVDYQIVVETGQSGIDSNVILCIYGEETATANLALRTIPGSSEGKFARNSRLKFDLKTTDVGKITKINIGHDGAGEGQQWFLKSAQIHKNDEHYIFKADRWLGKENNTAYIDLLPGEEKKDQALYTITVVTSSNINAGTDSGVFITIFGDTAQTKQVPLLRTKQGTNALFEPGRTDVFEVQLKDVGNINKVHIAQDNKGLQPSWHLEAVQIQKGEDIYKFHADAVLDLSTPDINLLPILSRRPSVSSPPPPVSSSPSPSKHTKEIPYKVSVRASSRPSGAIHDSANLYLMIVGEDGQTNKMCLRRNPKTGKIELEFKAADVGKVSKIILSQDKNDYNVVWRVESVIIRRSTEMTTFNVSSSFEQNKSREITPGPLHGKSDVHYEIKTLTADETFQGKVTLRIRGEQGTISIPLLTNKADQEPFQGKAVDEFTCRTTDVGRIKCINIEHEGATKDNVLHLKRIQIIKGNEIYQFMANARVDDEDQKVVLYAIPHRKEDYVESQLRRLRNNLRSESAKRRRPAKKAHEPFVYNDLKPYFDTTTVEKAIYEPLDATAGYYTRLTALRIVEPWEAYGMDYGVNYELLKQRKLRSHSAKRPLTATQTGMMILPPLSLPYGGQVTYVNPAQLDDSMHKRSARSSARHRSP